MVSIRYAVILLAALFLAAQGLTLALAQQPGQRKVFTNEDVARPSRPAPAPAAEAPAEKASAAEPAPAAATPAEQLTGPQAELKRALELQAIFRQAVEEYVEKLNNERDPTRQDRWDRMVACLSTLLQLNQYSINELQASSQ